MQNWEGKAYIIAGQQGYSPYLELDLDQAKSFLAAYGQRVLLSFKGGGPYHRALQKRKDGYALILLSKAVLKEIGAQVGDLIEFTIAPDRSAYGMPMAEEFAEALALDPEGKKGFAALSPGRKRGLLHYVDSGKSTDTRIKRAWEVLEKIKTGTLSSDA